MLRTIALTVANESRLLLRDPVVLLMLVLAPVVIIMVAGYSLGGLYGRQARVVDVSVVDRDHGDVGDAIVRALRSVRDIEVVELSDVEEAKRRLRATGAAPLAIEIPEGATEAIRAGRDASLVVYVDAARRLEVNALELEIDKLCRHAGTKIRESARTALSTTAAELAPPGFVAGSGPAIPGGIGFDERPAIDGAPTIVNAFDQYVPGFGVTFLLIGMMLGIALTLFDERDWGTLERVRAGGAPLAGVFVGKVLARFAVGVAQMVILFAVGWGLFGISLGRDPLALLLPTVAMSFAAASLGLIVPALAGAHDSVMPLGTMTSMAFAAIGGCWWPLDFEPEWLRRVADWLPTTWTMQAYNDLMIRRLPWSVAVAPTLATAAVGVLFLAAGVYGNLRRRS